MLRILMYHQIINTPQPIPLHYFYEHLTQLAKHHPIVTPGDTLSQHQNPVCLTFDDAYFDFYHVVYPKLKALNIKAVLAVPVKYILDDTALAAESRLNVNFCEEMNNDIYKKQAPFCTWKELKEMADSGHVILASHSFNHLDLTDKQVDLDRELTQSKKMIEQKTDHPVDTFVYPYGTYNVEVNTRVLQDYDYCMRIGSALNHNWRNKNNVAYRIDAWHYWPQQREWKIRDQYKYHLKYLTNVLRNK